MVEITFSLQKPMENQHFGSQNAPVGCLAAWLLLSGCLAAWLLLLGLLQLLLLLLWLLRRIASLDCSLDGSPGLLSGLLPSGWLSWTGLLDCSLGLLLASLLPHCLGSHARVIVFFWIDFGWILMDFSPNRLCL